MAYVLMKDTLITVKLQDGTLHNGPIGKDFRFEWHQRVTTPEEERTGRSKFRFQDCYILCDTRDVLEFSPEPRVFFNKPFTR